ncbi:MAG: peptidase [Candidatus Scalindua rubra]|uniref:Peptidase n=1 Tax=Candidatus Scalindua rubra TaxID=1872076 RepID=A0A1E3XFD9_9BACT|nr:MAG: peptidase [Candidatus Scalindua rubra]
MRKKSQQEHKKPELIAPAGDMNKLKTAIEYGADAVYAGGKEFNLRNAASNFTLDDIGFASDYVHKRDKKIYIALNIFAHNYHIHKIEQYLRELAKYPVDALIFSDPGVLTIVKDILPEIPIHLSTQANCTNYESVNFWYKQGIKRIVLARELSLDEISEISSSSDCETEVFVHGAMCISYSGRCYLSAYMANRGANVGDCAQSCRWKYSIVEEERPNEFFKVFEDGEFTSIMSSRDLCMIQHIPELISAGVDAWKIEGRMKSQYYVATVTRVYREAIDTFFENDVYKYQSMWLEELGKISHRDYNTGFFLGNPGGNGQKVSAGDGYTRTYKFIGLFDNLKDDKFAEVLVKNKFQVGTDIEVMGKKTDQDFVQNVKEMYNQEMKPIKEANPGQRVFIIPERPVEEYFIIRRKDCGYRLSS